MNRVKLDGRKMDNRVQTHAYLQQMLRLPDYYGRNLDALADCLSETGPVHITLTYPQAMLNALGVYGHSLLAVFNDQAAQRADFIIRVVQG